MNDESQIDDLARFDEVYGDLDLTLLETERWYPVFVYGTMCRQGRNAGRLRSRTDNHARYICLTSTKEYAFHLRSRKTEYGYLAPTAITEGVDAIAGELWEVRHTVLLELDMFEGHPTVYRRKMIPLTCDRHAWVYLYVGDTEGLSDLGTNRKKWRHPGAQHTLRWWVGK